MEFENQVTTVRVTIDTRPRVFLKWENTEEGRDKKCRNESGEIC